MGQLGLALAWHVMSDSTARRILIIVACVVAELIFFANVPTPPVIRFLVGMLLAAGLLISFRRADRPAGPKHRRRKRVGPAMEWID